MFLLLFFLCVARKRIKERTQFQFLYSKPFVQSGSSVLIAYLFLESTSFLLIIFLNSSELRSRSFLQYQKHAFVDWRTKYPFKLCLKKVSTRKYAHFI